MELLSADEEDKEGGDDDDDGGDRDRRGHGASAPSPPPPRRHRHHRHQALVHSSLVAEETSRFSRDDDGEDRERAISFFAPVGSRCWVKVVDVEERRTKAGGGGRSGGGGGSGGESGGFKISASMRSVSQEDGTDLDPEGRLTLGGGGGGGFGGDDGGARTARPPPPSQQQRRWLLPPGDGPLSPLPPAVGAILRARVTSVTKFGVFVLVEGWSGGRGLVHIVRRRDFFPLKLRKKLFLIIFSHLSILLSKNNKKNSDANRRGT